MQYTIKSTKALLLLTVAFLFSTSARAQCSYKSILLGLTVTTPDGWELSVNGTPKCREDSTNAGKKLLKASYARGESILCENEGKAYLVIHTIESTYLDQAVEKDFHKMMRYQYRKMVFPKLKDAGFKPKNHKTIKETINGMEFSITKTDALLGKESIYQTYLYTWAGGTHYISAVIVPEDNIQKEKLLKILTEAINTL